MKWITACPVCASSEFDQLLECTDHVVSAEHFQLVRCRKCALVLTNPRPTDADLGHYYESRKYMPHQSAGYSLMASLYRIARSQTLNWKRKQAGAYRKVGRLLDFGCGTGEFINTMLNSHWKADGVEKSEEARTQAEAMTGQLISPSMPKVQACYDLITLWHVLEHLTEPAEMLDQFHSALVSQGTLFLALPNHQSYDARHYGSLWAGYDVPRHLWHFTPASVAQLLTAHGFKLVQTVPMKLDAYYVSLLSEKYAGRSLLLQYLNAIRIAYSSNRHASRNGNYSSLLYIAQRTQS